MCLLEPSGAGNEATADSYRYTHKRMKPSGSDAAVPNLLR